MAVISNPALDAFVEAIQDELVFGQVVVRRLDAQFEMRHVADSVSDERGNLRIVSASEVRDIVQHAPSGQFRPLKSAPNLPQGWKLIARSEGELELAVNQIYPGAIADWYAAQRTPPPVTNYRDFTNRQTGMYRITQKLTDRQAAWAIRATCHRDSCLKRRIWSVEGLPVDSVSDKSAIPCLEPCAILLEFARKAMRNEQEDAIKTDLQPGDLLSIIAGLETALKISDASLREADFDAPHNPRRLRYVLEKLRDLASPKEETAD